ncbi:BRO1 domain-containing protein BROX-like [Paramacrobiotus metropolitanus]|uniref:BRO1 domain-containing protein BROX-like n=1 Tax=Paramacrobiotus metropolitanus TaxID=2943436 RepID=UPI0024457354|nr:BRO1 domain-containing protein BROX-like [Paramacrobiotus metropolitanus]
MSHWFHRNPIKATAPQKFDVKGCTTDGQALKLCGDLRQCRAQLLTILTSPSQSVADVVMAYTNYVSLLQGLLQACDERGGESKLRYFYMFRWSNSIIPDASVEQQDAMFELIHISINLALWYMKRAAFVASKDSISVDEAKEVHRCLRLAAGVFKEMQTNYTGRLLGETPKSTDVDSRVLVAYVNQCSAEAQEVTIAQAIERKHAPALISALANETAKLFIGADASLAKVEEVYVGKWRRYLQLKGAIYEACAYCYCGENLLAQDKCGEAIKALQEANKAFDSSLELCKEYAKAKGVGSTVKPEQHIFFRNLRARVDRTLEKCERENGMIYHQKVPDVPPELEMKATFGLVSPETFTLPPLHPQWTPATYKAFDLGQIKRENKNNGWAKKGGSLPRVEEEPIPFSKGMESTSSGCSIQ